MRIQVTAGTYVAAFEPDDFPKINLLENCEYIHIPESYHGTSEDPYLITAFNNSLRQGNHVLLYTDSISVTQGHSNARAGAEEMMMVRFNLTFIGSGIALEVAHQKIMAALKKHKIVVTNMQIYYYLISELMEQEYLAQTTRLEALKYDYFETYFNFLESDFLTLTTLPSLEDLHKYRSLASVLRQSSKGSYYKHMSYLFTEYSDELWEKSQKLTFEDIEFLFKKFEANVISGFTEEAFFELVNMFIENPEETKTFLEQTPHTWLTKLFNAGK